MSEPSFSNPLEAFGVPKWFIREQIERGADGLSEIRKLAKAVYRRLALVYHADMGGNAAGERLVELTPLIDLLEDDSTVDAFARYTLDTGSLYTRQVKELAKVAEQFEERRLAALLRMVGVVDSWEVADVDSPVELVFGVPNGNVTFDTYAQTVIMPLGQRGPVDLLLAQHPDEDAAGRQIVREFSYGEPLHYGDRGWYITYLKSVTWPEDTPLYESNDTKLAYATHVHDDPQFYKRARLVGSVGSEAMQRAFERLNEDSGAVAALEGRGGTRATGLNWQPARTVTWIGDMSPSLRLGDYGVVAMGEDNDLRLALAGRLLASRSLTA